MLIGSDYEWPYSLGVNLETGTFAQLPFFVLPKRGEKRQKKELTILVSLLLVPGGESYCQAQMLYKPLRRRGDAAAMSTFTSPYETGG